MSQATFVVAVISPDRSIRVAVTSAMEDNPQVDTVWTLNEYPPAGQLTQIHSATGGCVVFLDFTDVLRARSIAAELDRSYPTAATVAIHLGGRQDDLLELMQLGIREVISTPMQSADIVRVCERAARKLHRGTEDEGASSSLYAFLPARPGSGATTIAVHSAAAASRLSEQPTLLIDFDLRLGLTSFLFKLHGERSVLDALTLSRQLDDSLWDGLLCRCGALDVLGSAPFEFSRSGCESGAADVLNFARRKYATVCVDLPGEMLDHEVETLRRAREIFLVCTSDLGTLHMAKRKANFLQTLDAHARVSVIMNRADARGAMPIKDVEELLQLPVTFTMPSAEREITEATRRAIPIEGRSTLSNQLEKVARRMVATAGEVKTERLSRRFIEFFSVTPVREKGSVRR